MQLLTVLREIKEENFCQKLSYERVFLQEMKSNRISYHRKLFYLTMEIENAFKEENL